LLAAISGNKSGRNMTTRKATANPTTIDCRTNNSADFAPDNKITLRIKLFWLLT
jgi:hypothetical protein